MITKDVMQWSDSRREKALQGVTEAKQFLEYGKNKLVPTLWSI